MEILAERERWLADRLMEWDRDALAAFVHTYPRGALSDAAVDVVERASGLRLALGVRADPFTLAQYLNPQLVKPWAYAKYLAGRLREALVRPSRVAISMPAQVGKSFWLRLAVLWALDARPDRRFIYLSYGDLLAAESALFVRDWSDAYADKLSFRLRQDMRARNRWMTDQGGGMLATGLGGTVAGFGGTVFFDDPLKNWQQAHSPTTRDRVWNEMRAVMSLRLAEDDSLVVASTRWHRDDPIGRLKKFAAETGEVWEFIDLPMIAERADDPLGRKPGELLAPQRYGPEAVQRRRALLGSYLWRSLEQQDPGDEDGGLVKRDWWRFDSSPIEQADEWISSWDMKLKDKRTGDYVVGQVWGRVGASFHLVDMVRGQWSQAVTRVAIAWMQYRHPQVPMHVVENTGYGPEVLELLRAADPDYMLRDSIADELGIPTDERPMVQAVLRRGLSGLVPETPVRSKLVRARAIVPLIEAGDVWLPEDRFWTSTVVDEWASFTGVESDGRHDDIVDTTSQALNRLRHGGGAITAPPAAALTRTPIDVGRHLGQARFGRLPRTKIG